jgi:hypothetical protein
VRTPAGAECAYYYEDFARGASRQECRAPRAANSGRWQPPFCGVCPVPGILAANSSPQLDLRVAMKRGPFGIGRRVEVEAWCVVHGPVIDDPHVGCPACNADADELLRDALE